MYCELMERVTVATGRYLAHEAGRLAGVPGDRIGQWARWGHIRASISAGEPHVYAFEDVAEALAVHLLLDAGVALPVVRRAVDPVDLLRRGGWPARVTGRLDAVWVDPARAGGRPCVRGTRVPVEESEDPA